MDESEVLFDCVKLGRLKLEVYVKFELTTRVIPQYSFEDFMNGVPNPILFELGITKFFNELELHKIMKWQEETLIEVVDRETSLVIKGLQTKCSSVTKPEEFLKGELVKIILLKEAPKNDIGEIGKLIFNLYSFKGMKNNNLDTTILLYSYDNFINKRCGHKFLTPSNFEYLKGKKRTKKDVIFTTEITIFYIIEKLRIWIELVLEKGSWNETYLIFNWKERLEQKLVEVKQRIETDTKEIELKLVDTPENMKEQVRFKYFNFYRSSFNNFNNKRYFEFYSGVTSDYYLRKYTNYGYFEGNPSNEVKQIGEAIYIQNMAWRANKKFVEAAQDHFDDYSDMEEFVNEIPAILSHMVYDKISYVNTQLLGNPLMDEIWYYGLPKEMMEFNYREYLENHLESMINKLEVYLKEAEQNKGILYLQSRLKQMRLRNLDYRKYRFTDQHNKIKTKYSERLKEYLEIEADFINGTKDIETPRILTVKSSGESFDTIFPGTKGEFILDLLEDLSITVNGISQLSDRRKGAVRGVVDALLENNVAPNISIEILCRIIADKISLPLNSKLNFTNISQHYQATNTAYIKKNYIH
ncbi:MAG: hypothetical protein IPI65_06160 [Bacteroidetes bacterium]|nr:hypothetical protein [Bacteroidota bacterium]